MLFLPKEVETVITTLQGAGYSPYLVGGCVREMLRGKEPSDYDMTSDAPPEEVLHIYLARDLHRGAAHLDPGEFLNVERHPLEELVQMALDGELCDGKTTVALLKTQLLLARERGEAASGGL